MSSVSLPVPYQRGSGHHVLATLRHRVSTVAGILLGSEAERVRNPVHADRVVELVEVCAAERVGVVDALACCVACCAVVHREGEEEAVAGGLGVLVSRAVVWPACLVAESLSRW